MTDHHSPSPSITVTRLAAIVRVLVATAALLTVALVWWFVRHDRTTRDVAGFDRSVAVLPFARSVDDTATAALGQEVADAMANTLSQVPGLRVARRPAVDSSAAPSIAVQDIGKALGVSTILRGTVQRVGSRIRVSAEFVNAQNGRVLWNQKYDRDERTRYMIENEIARAVVAQLQLEWPPALAR